MTEPTETRDNERTEQTIVPVRRPDADAPDPARAAASSRWRGPLAGFAAVFALAAVVAVFVYLPAWVEQEAPAPEPEPEPVETVEPEPEEPALSAEEYAALRERAESLLAELLEQRQDVEARSAASWGDTTWTAYETAAQAADDALIADDVREAVRQYETALETGEALLDRSEDIMADALAAGEEAIAVGNAELATTQFEIVLGVDPDNARAKRGLDRAAALPSLLEAMRRGDEARERGELAEAAEAYRDALAIDPDWPAARAALGQVTAVLADNRFDALISQGYAAIDEGRYERAIERFNEAAAMRPGAAEAEDGLEQARQSEIASQIALAEARAFAFERRELWDEAIARYQEALAVDPTLKFAIDGLARSRARADLDAKLQNFVDNPRLLLTGNVLESAEGLLADAQAVEEPGPRITEQAEQLGELIALASTPLKVPLVSDGLTEVEIYRVGKIGAFTSLELELKPGTYTAIGIRRGYRDVREQFEVLPGREIEPVRIVCVEEI